MSLSSQSTVTPDAARDVAQPTKQIVEGRYIDREKLINVLTSTFGEGNFAVRLQLNRWILFVPQKLTEEQIEACFME